MKTMLAVAAGAAMASAWGGIAIRTDYPGANVKVLGIDEAKGEVRIVPDFRDTKGKWFRFDFVLTGAAGRKLHFQFPEDKYNYLSTLGPAISRDGGGTWRWLNADGTRHEPANAFDYTFAADEDATRFAVSIPYQQTDWEKFTAKWKNRPDVKFDVLCKSQSGRRDTELLRIPCRRKAKWLFAVTARHHASETTGNAVMEGIIEEALSGSPEGEWLRDNADCVFVPFMDKDGVEDGDQGKNRKPHDHNRDYIEGRYTSVRALKELLVRESKDRQIVFFDLHAPGVRSTAKSKVHDYVFTFDSFMPDKCARMNEFRRNWVEAQKGGALAYDGKRDSLKGAKGREEYESNKKKGLMTSRQWVQDLPNCWMSICGEFGYSMCSGVFSLAAGRELGRSMMKAGVRTVKGPDPAKAAAKPKAAGLDLGGARLAGRPPETLIACGGGSVWLLSPDGKVTWRKDGCGNIHRAVKLGDKVYWSNGSIWVTDIPTKNTELFYRPAPRDGTYGFCITDAGTMVVSENATDYITELKLDTKEVVARFKGDPKGTDGKTPGAHHHYRMVRKTAAGTYLVCCSGAHVVREYDATGKLVWEQPAPDLAFEALRRANGNTLVSHLGAVTEYTPDHKAVWSFSCGDAPELKLANLCGIHERADGNLVVGTYANGVEDGSRTTAFEVTRGGRIVWSYAPAGRRLSTMTVLPVE